MRPQPFRCGEAMIRLNFIGRAELVLVLLPLMLLTGCAKSPISTQRTDNPAVQSSLLATIDGCRVWRFEDGGRLHYFARCADGSRGIELTYSESCGKNCTRQVDASIIAERH